MLQYCQVDQLRVDEGYQRSLESKASARLIRRIASNWDWGLCQPLYVARRDDGQLYVVDGQHRWAAAKLRGDLWQLPCVVRSFANAKEEAAAFVALNQERTPLTALQMFRAAIASGDAEACGVMGIVEMAGMRIATTSNLQQCPPGSLSNIAGLKTCWRAHGKTTLLNALRVLGRAYPDQKMRYAGSIFPGVVAVVAAAVKSEQPGAIDKIVELVASRPQEKWVSAILQLVANDPWLNRGTAAVIVFKAAQRGEEPKLTREMPKPVPVAKAAPVAMLPAETDWCNQCDQRVSGAKVAQCADPFCALKRQKAA